VTFVGSGVGSGEEGDVVGVPYIGLRFPGLDLGWSHVSRLRSSGPLSLEVSSWRILSFSEHLNSRAPSRGCRTPSQEPHTSCFVLDGILLGAGDLVVVLGRRHFLELVKSQKA